MRAKGPAMLLAAAALWGLTFVAQTSAAQDVGPFTFNASRNIVGVLFLSAVIAARKRAGHDVRPVPRGAALSGAAVAGGADDARDVGKPGAAYTTRELLVGGVACGVILFAASALQQSGITSYPPEAAASSRSGFITALYMVMVAVWMLFATRKVHPVVLVSVGVALGGMYLLCVPDGLSGVYVGDLLVLACAVGYAAHIVVVDRYTNVDGVRLSRVQLLTSFAISFVCALVFERPSAAGVLAALVPILYAGICSDGIAYTFQIVGQKTTDATVAAIIMSLESVFAALGGWLILSERLSGVELFGCVLVFGAVLLSQTPEFVRNARAKRAAAKEG